MIFAASKLNRVIRVLLSFLFIANMADSLLVPVFAVFVKDFLHGATFATVGFAVAFLSIAKSIVQVPVARYLDRKKGEFDDFLAMMLGSVVSSSYPFLVLLMEKPWHLYAVSALAGIGQAFLMAAYYAVFARHVDKGAEGFEWSLFSVGGLTVSTAIGAAVGGLLADTFGLTMLFVIAGLLNIVATILLLFLRSYLLVKKRRLAPSRRLRSRAAEVL